ncbi:hypothetical protein LV164_001169 [Aspergillus fumigatus]|nr:hypothetical protein KXX42_006979 [Aspergillus fumigatus]KAH1556760.1 hypothetical protein KXX57_009222 [Aspergillus fumigatus]KAH1985277.1 hypothetical protein KXW88_000870 [Aspergillus fumigatus]KAH2318302.1 hypothetical protein KXV47_007155 [Aspergillus fumigatus]KAH2675945.1 hypothetical protein KXV32_000020 [Aspergillus fumigatus]
MYNSNLDIWIAGAFAAVTVDFVVYPFDTLKTRVQSPDYNRLYKDAATGAVRRSALYRGLYQGVWSVVLSTIPGSGAFFTTYEAVKYTLTNASKHHHSPENNPLPFTHPLPQPIIHAISSSTAEMVACLMMTPAEVLKQNAQVTNVNTGKGGQNAKSAMTQVIARFKHRPWKLWSGYTALVGRNLPFTGLNFPLFELFRSHLVEWRKRRKEDDAMQTREWGPVVERAALTGMAASMSGMIASVVTTPIDVIKTRMMLSASCHNNDDSNKSTKKKMAGWGTLRVGKEIYRNEGIRGLFKGGAIRAAWTAASLSMYLSIYEGGRFYLENRRREKHGLNTRVEVDGSKEEAAI